jgi:hypothetical protein
MPNASWLRIPVEWAGDFIPCGPLAIQASWMPSSIGAMHCGSFKRAGKMERPL